jgi:hypothetical protein
MGWRVFVRKRKKPARLGLAFGKRPLRGVGIVEVGKLKRLIYESLVSQRTDGEEVGDF